MDTTRQIDDDSNYANIEKNPRLLGVLFRCNFDERKIEVF